MICCFPKWWEFPKYYGFKYYTNVTERLDIFAEERIKVLKEEDGTSSLNQEYDKLQENQDKSQTRQLLEMAWRKVHGRITQWQLIMIISTSVQNIPAKVWTNLFVAVNLHPRRCLYFSDWIKNIAPAVKTGDITYFWNDGGYYYYAMPSVWNNMTVI